MATDIARKMVTEWGMSDRLGPLSYGENEQEIFLGHSVSQQRNISDETARIIDEEIRKIVEEGEKKANNILTKNIGDLHKIAKGLLEYETLTADDVENILSGNKLKKNESEFSDSNTDLKNKETKHKGSVPNSENKKRAMDKTKNKNPRPSEV